MIRQGIPHDRQTLFELSNTSLALDYLSAQDFYFAHCFDAENLIVNEVNGHAVASLQVSYHTMMLHDVRIMASLFYGLLTDQNDTSGKWRRDLFLDAINEQSYRTLVTLLPTNEPEEYRRFGFMPVYQQKHYIVGRRDMPSASYYGTDKQFTISQLSAVYQAFISHFNGYILRDKEYWLKLIDELTVRRLNLAVYHCNHQAEGYMIYRLSKKQTEVVELVYLNGKALIRLLNYGLRFKPQLDIAVSADEDLNRIFPKSPYTTSCSMTARVNDYKLFNSLYQSQVHDVQAAFAISPKPLFNDERF